MKRTWDASALGTEMRASGAAGQSSSYNDRLGTNLGAVVITEGDEMSSVSSYMDSTPAKVGDLLRTQ